MQIKKQKLHHFSRQAFTVRYVFTTFMVMFLLSGCTISPKTANPLNSGLLLAEPELVSTKAQLAVAHYTSTLYRAQLTVQERAELLFQRGVAFDSMGLTALARRDYAEALSLNPTLADAHNSIGVLYTQAGMHMLAYESFDSTLEINPNYDFALFNRGIALYYGGRARLAVNDTAAYLERDPSDPIRALWHYAAYRESTNQKDAQAMLLAARGAMSSDLWSTSIVDYYLGNTGEGAVIAALLSDVSSQTQLNYRLCEAYFYLGKYSASRGQYTKAENYFKLALSTNVFEYIEHKYARIELADVRQARLEQLRAQ